MCPHSVTVKRKSIWLQWAIIGYNRDEADSQERLGDLWTGNVCCSSQHFTANVFPARAASLPQDNLHWCLTSFTQCSFASVWMETAVRPLDQPPIWMHTYIWAQIPLPPLHPSESGTSARLLHHSLWYFRLFGTKDSHCVGMSEPYCFGAIGLNT